MQRPRNNKRKQIREMARKAKERAQGESPESPSASPTPRSLAKTPGRLAARGPGRFPVKPPPAPPAEPEEPPKPTESMKCICGQVIRVQVDEGDEVRCSCPNCNRKFDATVVLDPQSGKREIFPMFLDDADPTGQTITAEAAGTESAMGMEPSAGAESDFVLEHGGGEGESLGLTPPPSSQPAVPRTPTPPPPVEPAELTFACFCGKKMLAKRDFFGKRVRCPGCFTRLILTLTHDPIANVWQISPSRMSDPPTGDTKTMPTV